MDTAGSGQAEQYGRKSPEEASQPSSKAARTHKRQPVGVGGRWEAKALLEIGSSDELQAQRAGGAGLVVQLQPNYLQGECGGVLGGQSWWATDGAAAPA